MNNYQVYTQDGQVCLESLMLKDPGLRASFKSTFPSAKFKNPLENVVAWQISTSLTSEMAVNTWCQNVLGANSGAPTNSGAQQNQYHQNQQNTNQNQNGSSQNEKKENLIWGHGNVIFVRISEFEKNAQAREWFKTYTKQFNATAAFDGESKLWKVENFGGADFSFVQSHLQTTFSIPVKLGKGIGANNTSGANGAVTIQANSGSAPAGQSDYTVSFANGERLFNVLSNVQHTLTAGAQKVVVTFTK